MENYKHIKHWLFDLDNTLYPPSFGIIEQIDENIIHYVKDFLKVPYSEAVNINTHYVKTYGGSIAGLYKEHQADPQHFMVTVLGQVDQSNVKPIEGLKAFLEKLPGEKYIFTNSHYTFANEVIEKMGLEDIFKGVFDIEAAGYKPKPYDIPYNKIVENFSLDPKASIFFEDTHRNLAPAHRLGMSTVLLGENLDPEIVSQDYIHSTAPDLLSWFKTQHMEKAS